MNVFWILNFLCIIKAINDKLSIMAKKNIIKEKDIKIIGGMTRKLLIGSMIFYINKRITPREVTEYKKLLQTELMFILK